jgi:hypothetical protein
MHAAYQDTMAIAGRFKKPDLFLTMVITNPNMEVKHELLLGQNAMDQLNFIFRGFKQRMPSRRGCSASG